MQQKFLFTLIASLLLLSTTDVIAGTDPCDSVRVTRLPGPAPAYNADSTLYMINKQDRPGKKGVFQIYIGKRGDKDSVLTCISLNGPNGKKRSFKKLNKMQVQWHPSGKFLICAVEWDNYPELHYTPRKTLLGLLACGIWMDIWAVTPDGKTWTKLVKTVRGFTGPAFTPDGSKCVYAEAKDTGDLRRDKFGCWWLRFAEFNVVNGVPSLSNIKDITPKNTNWVEPGNFHPDGKRVMLTADCGMSDARGQDQFILNVYTGELINLNNTPTVWDEHGLFSPDGSKIVWMSAYPYRDDPNSSRIIGIKTEFMIMNIDGSDQRQLTHFCQQGYPEYGAGIAAVGWFEPDGRSITCYTLLFPFYNYFRIDFAGPCGKAQSN
jgi:hypothetical protein